MDRIVAIISSAGGIHALLALLPQLPEGFPWPVLVAQHLPREFRSDLVGLLQTRTRMKVAWASDGDVPVAGRVYVARPHHQMRIGRTGLSVTERDLPASSWLEAADVLLQSVARRYRAGSVAVVLSGKLPAGIRGVRDTIAAGGIAFAESAASATYSEMPIAAIDHASVDLRASADRIGTALAAMAEYGTQEGQD
jgi:two-component system chemotaxis response regulator CheB